MKTDIGSLAAELLGLMLLMHQGKYKDRGGGEHRLKQNLTEISWRAHTCT